MELFNINRVALKLNVNKQMIRKWETEFNLKISRNNDGARCYTEKDINLLENIKVLKKRGLSSAEITNHIIRDDAFDECAVSIVESDSVSIQSLQETMVAGLKNTMSEIIGDIVIEREKELKREFEDKLENKLDDIKCNLAEEITHNIKKQVRGENQKLMLYLSTLRQENQKGFFAKMFGSK